MTDFSKIIDNSETIVGFLLLAFGIDVRYTYEGLKEVERKINEIYPFGHKPLTTTLIPFAILLGETIIRNIPSSKWEAKVDSIWNIRITIPFYGNQGDMEMFPFRRLNRFWTEDREYNLSSCYTLAKFCNEVDIHKPGYLEKLTDEDGWVHFPTGESIRLKSIKPEDQEKILKEMGITKKD